MASCRFDFAGRAWPAAIPWLVAAAIGLGAGTATAGPTEPKFVVVIYPNESDGAPGTVLTNHAIRATFANESPDRIDVRNEYVDTSRLGDPDFRRTQVSLLKQKYAGRKIDLVVAGLSSGLDFVLANRDELFPVVPVVFVAVDEREAAARRLPADVVGSPIHMDLAGTLDLALRLHPGTRKVFVIAGSAPFDTEWAAEARRAFAPRSGEVEFEYLVGLPMDELLGRVADLPAHSLVYYLHMFQDGAGATFIPAEALERLAARANAPIYGHVDTYVGRGAVGGHAFQFEAEGTSAARLGLRILAGERPDALNVAGSSSNTYLFDARELKRWDIDPASLPPGSVVRFQEVTFWDRYRQYVIGVLAVCVGQAILIACLLFQRWKRRKADAALRESESRFRTMADAAPVLVWLSGLDKRCTYVSRPWLEFTGRPFERELGDGWADGIHPDDVRECLAIYGVAFDQREPFEMMYRLRRHDGKYRWILDRGAPRFGADGRFAGYVGACIDVTERRQAEDGLRASREELQRLAGQFIEAQEAERRRVARELHDDLNQGLALLAMEIDATGQRPPAAPAEITRRMQDLSARVRELSTTVHNLSHQLHPSKLEHLGLKTALRGLCNEVGQHHGLTIELATVDVPDRVPDGVAVCLYRIAQEALRNVVKHAGTDRARVELTGSSGQIGLTVSDTGAGFDPAVRQAEGLGLVSMRERLSLVRGRLVIESNPGGGTRICVTVPLPEAADELGSLCGDELVGVGTAAGGAS